MPFIASSEPSGAPFVVAVMFVAGPMTPALFSSDEIPPVIVVFDGCRHIFRFECHERCHINALFEGAMRLRLSLQLTKLLFESIRTTSCLMCGLDMNESWLLA